MVLYAVILASGKALGPAWASPFMLGFRIWLLLGESNIDIFTPGIELLN